MLFRSKRPKSALKLQRGVLRLEKGFIIGLFPDPKTASPCQHCAELWLKEKGIFTEQVPTDSVPITPRLWSLLEQEASPHVLLEVAEDLQGYVRMDCIVIPHPHCFCRKESFVAPMPCEGPQFTFSPVVQLKSARYAIPTGNLWLTQATGSLTSGQKIEVVAAAGDREAAREKAFQKFLAEEALDRFQRLRVKPNTQNLLSEAALPWLEGAPPVLGVGKEKDAAILDGLRKYVMATVLGRYGQGVRNPTLLTSTHSFIRDRMPFFVLQQFDIHLLYFPTSFPCWVIGVLGIPRQNTHKAPLFAFQADATVEAAAQSAIYRFLEILKPSAEGEATPEDGKESQLNLWWNAWVYRSPKMSVLDLLVGQPEAAGLDLWKAYFRDGQTPMGVVSLNTLDLPATILQIVGIQSHEAPSLSQGKVLGIGTWRSFQKGV